MNIIRNDSAEFKGCRQLEDLLFFKWQLINLFASRLALYC